jgi:hypothetical protein
MALWHVSWFLGSGRGDSADMTEAMGSGFAAFNSDLSKKPNSHNGMSTWNSCQTEDEVAKTCIHMTLRYTSSRSILDVFDTHGPVNHAFSCFPLSYVSPSHTSSPSLGHPQRSAHLGCACARRFLHSLCNTHQDETTAKLVCMLKQFDRRMHVETSTIMTRYLVL